MKEKIAKQTIYKITKRIEFCYGHRLINYGGKCKHLHGHNAVLEADIINNTLNDRGMIIDFSELKEFMKKWVDEHFDHRMILSRSDDLASTLQQLGEPIYLLNENPTAENIAKEIFSAFKKELPNLVEIRLWEASASMVSVREV